MVKKEHTFTPIEIIGIVLCCVVLIISAYTYISHRNIDVKGISSRVAYDIGFRTTQDYAMCSKVSDATLRMECLGFKGVSNGSP